MFDTELFINEVSIRPPLWNMTLKEYSDRDRKCKLWIEVGSIMVEKWAELSDQEKNNGVKELQKKWRSLRDAFTREFKNQKMPSGSGNKKTKKYVYFDNLLFLAGSTEDIETITNFSDSPHRSENEDISHPGPSSAQESSKAKTSYRPKKPKLSTFESAVLKYISNEQQTASDDDEGDKQFLLSFLPVMKKLTMDKKMWARLKITEIMQQAVYNTSQPNSFQAPFPNQILPQNMQYCIPNQQQFQSGFQYNNTPQFQTLTNISSTNSVKNNIQQDHELSAASPLSSVLSPSPSESTTSDVFSVIGQSMNMSDSSDYIH